MSLPLANGQVALIDEGDLAKVSHLKWSSHPPGYVQAHDLESHRTVYLHRLVLDAQAGEEVDHRNRDKLDNRRENLRIATRHQQMQNRGPRRDSRTGLKGVELVHRQLGPPKFRAHIRTGGVRRSLGTFDDANDAALAYDQVALEAFGEFAYLNFPELARVGADEAPTPPPDEDRYVLTAKAWRELGTFVPAGVPDDAVPRMVTP